MDRSERKLNRRTLLKSLAVAGPALLAACAAPPSKTQPPPLSSASGATTAPQPADANQTLVISITEGATNLNPIYGSVFEGNLKFFNGLLTYDKELKLVPELATAMPEFSADGKTVTVKIRDDVKFHDGSPLTADDVAFTYNTIIDPKSASPQAGDYDALKEAKALDKTTVQFTLTRPGLSFLHRMWIGIVPKAALEGQDIPKAAFNKAPIGTGPYTFKGWKEGERLVMEANPNYFKGAPKIKRVVISYLEDEDARAAQLADGTADIGGFPPKLAARFRDDKRYTVFDVPSADVRVIALPNDNPILKDPVVRRALAMGIDREAMVKGILNGAGEPAYGPVSSIEPYYDATPIQFSPDKAMEIC